MSSQSFLVLGAILAVVLMVIFAPKLWRKKVPLESATNHKTPYVVDYFFPRQVYHQRWDGDGLWGGYVFKALEGVTKDKVVFHDIVLGPDTYVILQDRTDFYLFEHKLPFNPLQEKIRAIEGRPAPVLWTEKRVFHILDDRLIELVGADGSSFRRASVQEGVFYGYNYFVDENKVFYLSHFSRLTDGGGFTVVEGLSPKVVLKEIAGPGYLSDGKVVVFEGKLIKVADLTTFSRLGENDRTEYYAYAKDRNHVYYNGEIVEGAEPATFAAIGEFSTVDTTVMKDSRAVYFRGKAVPSVDPKSARMEVSETTYLTDSSGLRLHREYDTQSRGWVLK